MNLVMMITVIEKFTTAVKRLNVCFLEHIFHRRQNDVPALKSKKISSLS